MCKNSGFRLRIQKSYKKFGIESKNLIIFSESIPNLLPHPCFLGLTQIAQISQAFFVGGKSHGCSAPLLPKAHTDSTRFNEKIICGNLWQKKSLQKNICVIREIRGSKTSHEFVSFGVRLWVRQHFNPSRIYSNIDSIFLGVMTL